MERYTLTVTLPLDDNYDKVADYLKTVSYTKIFSYFFDSPHRLKYIVGPLSESDVLKLKDDFRRMFKDSKFRNFCSFNTEIFKDDI